MREALVYLDDHTLIVSPWVLEDQKSNDYTGALNYIESCNCQCLRLKSTFNVMQWENTISNEISILAGKSRNMSRKAR